MAPQITRRGETIDTGKAGFVKIPIEEMKVGHAGLYHDDEDENTPAPVNTSDDSDAANQNTNPYYFGRIEYRKNGGIWEKLKEIL